jgi:hypothetical protein
VAAGLEVPGSVTLYYAAHSLASADLGLTAVREEANTSRNVPRDTCSHGPCGIETGLFFSGFIACVEYILIGEICLRRATVCAVLHHQDVVAHLFDVHCLSAFRASRIRHWGCLPFLRSHTRIGVGLMRAVLVTRVTQSPAFRPAACGRMTGHASVGGGGKVQTLVLLAWIFAA